MKKVYEPANVVEAHMLQDYLRQEEIGSEVHGGALTGAIGELPAAGLVRLMVNDEDYERAREALHRWESASKAAETSSRQSVTAPEGRKSRFWAGLTGLLVGVGIGHVYYQTPLRTDGIDHNYDGKLDEIWKRSLAGTISSSELDRNFDGKIDFRTEFDKQGDPTVAEADDNFDGVFETKYRYSLGNVSYSEVDTDNDGLPNTKSQFKYGVIESTEFINPFSGLPVRREHYQNSGLHYAEVDANKDGKMDKRIHYSPDQEVVKTESIQPDN